MKEPELWERVSVFVFDRPEAEFSFSDRLSRENGWSRDFTLRVIEEYRRFLYLACVSDHQVTPSDEVDQAWHLHLCYTRSYWKDLCQKTLRRKLHHGPTKGGVQDADRFLNQYNKTLDSYRSEFGHCPPESIWPDSKRRFRNRKFTRVDRSEFLLISKSGLRLACIATGMSVFLLGCELVGGEDFPVLPIVLVVVILFLIVSAIRKGGGGKGGNGCGGCGGISGRGDSDSGDSGCGGGGCGGCSG